MSSEEYRHLRKLAYFLRRCILHDIRAAADLILLAIVWYTEPTNSDRIKATTYLIDRPEYICIYAYLIDAPQLQNRKRRAEEQWAKRSGAQPFFIADSYASITIYRRRSLKRIWGGNDCIQL